MQTINLQKYIDTIESTDFIKYNGEITKVTGLTIESKGPQSNIGELCYIKPFNSNKPIMAEVVGFKDDKILLMPFGDMEGIGPGSKVIASGHSLQVSVGEELIGRVLDGLGNPMDGKGDIYTIKKYPVSNMPPNPLQRTKISKSDTIRR